jgi:hypothetical protein
MVYADPSLATPLTENAFPPRTLLLTEIALAMKAGPTTLAFPPKFA